ncbi:MAG: pyruvate/2-oxoglutarate dehydrogenase complex, dihydrolipoamide acyltransferase (E2) component, partial [Marinosulfonomonas sp.]
MQIARGTIALALIAVLAVSACGGRKDPQLMNIRSNTDGPDEFTILPGK